MKRFLPNYSKAKLFTLVVLSIFLVAQYTPLVWADDNIFDEPTTVQGFIQEGINYHDPSGECSEDDTSTTSDSSPVTDSGSSGGFTLNQITTFLSEPVSSTWNISDGTVEQWFLKTNTTAIAKYGLNSSNIGQITSAVEAAGVSPVFFYLDTVNEGGGAGGFINHYSDEAAGGGPGNATRDAQYIADESKQTNGTAAAGGGEPADMPTAEAQQILNALPSGSIGVYYIQATSAVTAELETLSGKTGDWIGEPLSAAMQNIETMGGDPEQGGSTISTSGCASPTGDGPTATCSATKPFGGVSATQDSPQYTQAQLVQLFGDPGTAASHPAMDANLTTVNFNGHPVQVNKKAAGCLTAVAQQIASENINYTINDISCYRFDSDNGTSNIGLDSYHTYGAACDINPDTNPFSESGANLPHDMPQAYVQAFYDHGWSWGGNWSQPKDFMHFEFNGLDPPGN